MSGDARIGEPIDLTRIAPSAECFCDECCISQAAHLAAYAKFAHRLGKRGQLSNDVSGDTAGHDRTA